MYEDPVNDALNTLVIALREEVREEEKVSMDIHQQLKVDHIELKREHAQLQKDFEELQRRNQGMLNHLQRIRTKADMASGYDNKSGGCEEAAEKGRSAGAEGAVDRLIAMFAGKLMAEREE